MYTLTHFLQPVHTQTRTRTHVLATLSESDLFTFLNHQGNWIFLLLIWSLVTTGCEWNKSITALLKVHLTYMPLKEKRARRKSKVRGWREWRIKGSRGNALVLVYLSILVLGVCDGLCRPLLPIHMEHEE